MPDSGNGLTVELSNPNGLQLLTQSHFMRAPDKRFAEPEEILEDSNADCARWKQEIGPESPCTNDFDGRFGKAFIRSAHARAVWTHGGALGGGFANVQLTHGAYMHTEACPSPICEPADVNKLHIYHYRSAGCPSSCCCVPAALSEASRIYGAMLVIVCRVVCMPSPDKHHS